MQFPRFLRLFYPDLTWRVKTSSKVIYLTFDDGPVPEVTPQVLDILDQYGWKATFFHVADNVRKYPALYQEVLKKGHRVGNHTFSHLKGFTCTTDEYVANVHQAAGYIKSNLFRPPYGRIRSDQILALKKDFNIIMWDVITHDYSSRNDADKIMKTLRRYLRPGSIVVFHDSVKAQKNVLEALPKAIEYWQQKGYTYGLL